VERYARGCRNARRAPLTARAGSIVVIRRRDRGGTAAVAGIICSGIFFGAGKATLENRKVNLGKLGKWRVVIFGGEVSFRAGAPRQPRARVA